MGWDERGLQRELGVCTCGFIDLDCDWLGSRRPHVQSDCHYHSRIFQFISRSCLISFLLPIYIRKLVMLFQFIPEHSRSFQFHIQVCVFVCLFVSRTFQEFVNSILLGFFFFGCIFFVCKNIIIYLFSLVNETKNVNHMWKLLRFL